MFGFWKKKDSSAETEIAETIEEVSDVTSVQQVAPEEEDKIIETPETLTADDENISDNESMETEESPVVEAEDTEEEKTGFFAKLRTGLGKTRNALNEKVDNVLKYFKKIDEDLYEELEEALIMADVGVETSTYIIEELRKKVKEKHLTESQQVKGEIQEIVADILSKNDNSLNLDSTPSVIMVIGVNGVGKTTSIGKIAARYISEGKKVLLGAADTFRAAAIDQLQIWADRVGADIIKHEEGSDPASVVFDTIAAAKSRKSDVIIIDTAGRLHNKKNLMDELAKISRIIERELPGASRETLLVLDATTGQNAVNQVEVFTESAGITGIILTKLDGSAKGGIVLAIAHEHSIPVKLVGVGEGMDDLQEFDATDFANAMIGE